MHGSTGGRWKRSGPDAASAVLGPVDEKRHPYGLGEDHLTGSPPPRQRSTLPVPPGRLKRSEIVWVMGLLVG
jgi:hypothetical protein